MKAVDLLALSLANAFFSGPWTLPGLVERAQKATADKRDWIAKIADTTLHSFPSPPESIDVLTAFLTQAEELFRAKRLVPPAKVFTWVFPTPRMANRDWKVPEICTDGDLEDFLNIPYGKLDWFADPKHLLAKRCNQRLRHYRFQWVDKKSKGRRLLESPKLRLKTIQRTILRNILNHAPTHPAAHGFVTGRSTLSFAEPHLGKELVLCMDLEEFFSSVNTARVAGVFGTVLGYPPSVAKKLSSLCTLLSPDDVRFAGRSPHGPQDIQNAFARDRRLATPHLPQGAPSSPALSNLVAFRLDCRLSQLAGSMGLSYTRYADDLAFSGGTWFRRGARNFSALVAKIVNEEGFCVNHSKTRLMTQSQCQKLTGIVVNCRPNLERKDFDRIKAILTNCVRKGPNTQNRKGVEDFRAYLAGKIAYVKQLNRTRGEKLEALFAQIAW